MLDRLPPSALEAEAALIGCVLVDPECLPDVLSRISANDFYSLQNAAVFAAIASLDESGIRPDRIALVQHLRQSGKLDGIGGVHALSAYTDVIPTVATVAYYTRLVADKAAIRRLLGFAEKAKAIAYEFEDAPEKAYSEAVDALQSADEGKHSSNIITPHQRLGFALKTALSVNKPKAVLLPWDSVNSAIGGCYPKQLCVWAGAPKAGKTNAAVCLSDHIARNYGTVAYFSMEMGEFEITERQLALYSGVDVKRQRSNDLSTFEIAKLQKAVKEGKDIPLMVFERDVRSIQAMRRILRRLQRQGPIKSIIVDHVGKMSEVLTANGKESKVERLDRTYNALIDLACEFDCTIHAIQHINRAGQQNGNRPQLIDIRDGGNPEGHANAVILVHRPDPMNLDMRAHIGEFIIAASRNGTAGIIDMQYDGWRGAWFEPRPAHAPQEAPTSYDWNLLKP